MANVNLLPWRAELREEKKKQFFAMLAAAAMTGAAMIGGWHMLMVNEIKNQNEQNSYLQTKISALDKDVEEIKKLKEKRAKLVERMRVIQELQGNRPEIVHIFDQLVRNLPDGVFFKSIKRTGDKLVINGTAESNNRVSSLMRSLDASPWFTQPNLQGVKSNTSFGEQANDFDLSVMLSAPNNTDQEEK